MMDTKKLDGIEATLLVQLSSSPKQIGDLCNERALPSARVIGCALSVDGRWPSDPNQFDVIPLTDDELDEVIHAKSTLCLCGLAGVPITHAAPNGREFTLRDVLAAVEETEKRTRSLTDWFGGIDVHHVFFEGLTKSEKDDSWTICWGS